jgi:hypothetical protein
MWPEDEVDHINGNTVDNRLVNLRACSRKNNIRNSHKRGAFTSRFLGVCWNKRQKKWVAQITVDHKNSNLGFYHEEELAALAYDAAAREHFGAFANCNFKEPS